MLIASDPTLSWNTGESVSLAYFKQGKVSFSCFLWLRSVYPGLVRARSFVPRLAYVVFGYFVSGLSPFVQISLGLLV